MQRARVQILALLALIACTASGSVLWTWWRNPVLPEPPSRLSLPREAGATTRQTQRDRQIALARSLVEESDYPGAVAALDRALEAVPGDAEALALQVRAFRAQRRYGAARAAALRILERFPQSPLAHILLGSIALQEGDAASARRGLERAISLDTSRSEE